jgi:hypothetical protein
MESLVFFKLFLQVKPVWLRCIGRIIAGKRPLYYFRISFSQVLDLGGLIVSKRIRKRPK